MVAVFTAFCIAIGGLCLRLYDVCTKGTEYVASEAHYYSIDIGSVRGEIFDCKGQKLVNCSYDNIAVIKPTAKGYSAVESFVDSSTGERIRERIKKGNAVSVNLGNSVINSNEDAIILKKYNRYESPQTASHIIGYIDQDGRGVSGIEKSFDNVLFTGKTLNVRFSADVYGRVISGADFEIQNDNLQTGSVTLTIDKEIQKIIENALDMYSIKEGGVIAAEVGNGAIRALASRPDYDRKRLSKYINAEGSPMVNRGLNAYAAGSVFKVAVAAAAIENGHSNFSYTCTGSCEIDGTVFGCNNRKAHGNLDMKKALECSCNTYFINLAREIGAVDLIDTVQRFGFGQEIRLADGLTSKSGRLPTENELQKSGELANFSFGQGKFNATMLQMTQLFSAIANGGKYYEPYLVEKVVTADGEESKHKIKYPVFAIKQSTSEMLTKMLVSVVENGNAKKAKPDGDFKAAGKTATAQTGTFYKNGVEICNTWFCGFFPADKPKYVVVILKQGGNSGAEDCAPVFRYIADKISELN